MESRIKEQQLDLFSDRTSCYAWWSNQFRLLLSNAAYILVEAIRRIGLAGTELAQAQVSTIRLKLLKIGAVVLRNTRRIQLLMSSVFRYQNIFAQVRTYWCCPRHAKNNGGKGGFVVQFDTKSIKKFHKNPY